MLPQHRDYYEQKTRYVYMIYLDNGLKSRHYGHRNELYTGQTSNLGRRIGEHLRGQNSKYLRNYFSSALKIPVFVKQLFGTQYDAMLLERKIKNMGRPAKECLIASEQNDLIRYVPLKALVLRKFPNHDGEEVIYLE